MRNSAAESLRDWLEWWRESGHPFDYAWTLSLDRACAGWEDWWREWFVATKETWRAAYELQEPSRSDAAMLALLESVSEAGTMPDREGSCEWCGNQLPEQRYATKRFCDDECRRKATRQRERERGTRYVAH